MPHLLGLLHRLDLVAHAVGLRVLLLLDQPVEHVPAVEQVRTGLVDLAEAGLDLFPPLEQLFLVRILKGAYIVIRALHELLFMVVPRLLKLCKCVFLLLEELRHFTVVVGE
jgi:hypothetical protein